MINGLDKRVRQPRDAAAAAIGGTRLGEVGGARSGEAQEERQGESSVQQELQFSRLLCAVAGGLYLTWYFVVRTLLPDAFNPLPSRLAVVAFFVVTLALSYVSRSARDHLQWLFGAGAWILTAHYYYLLYGSHADTNCVLGAYVTLVTVSASLVTRRSLLAYSLFAVALSVVVCALEPGLARSIFLPGVATMLLLSNLALHNRIRVAEQLVESRRGASIAKREIRKRDEFVAIASHELRTPLTPLKLVLQSLLRSAREPAASPMPSERIAVPIERSLRQVDRLCRLVEDMLDVAKMSARRFAVTAQNVCEVDLAELTREVIEDLAPNDSPERSGRGGAVSPIQLVTEGPIRCRCDPLRIEQAVGNLVKNAMNYGKGEPILVALQGHDSKVTIAVQDRGIGVAPADQVRIFERFERGVSELLPSGLGIGLYVVKEIVEAHGGTVRVTSAVGEGSCFTIELPREPRPVAPNDFARRSSM